MKRLLLALSLCAAALAAATPAKVLPYPYAQHDLANGLRLITIPTDYPNLVTLYIVVSVGSRNEVEPGKTGFAHLFEHMMFRGTEKFPPEKYQQVVQQAGTDSNAFTSDDITAYHVTFSKAEPLREAAKRVPAERILVETDSPYLAPVPLRGRPNEPANVVHTVAALAEARGEDAAELAVRIDANATAAFSLPVASAAQ